MVINDGDGSTICRLFGKLEVSGGISSILPGGAARGPVDATAVLFRTEYYIVNTNKYGIIIYIGLKERTRPG